MPTTHRSEAYNEQVHRRLYEENRYGENNPRAEHGGPILWVAIASVVACIACALLFIR